jgi:rSAM/selenodomain-associated transferase 2/rSAM/selenodomain-associated transferase 1
MKSKQTQEQLIVFSRYPEPGTTKTRLATALGYQGAAEIQKKLTEHTLSQVRKFLHLRPAAAIIYYEGGSQEQIQDWLGTDFAYQDQGSGDLGQRMQKAFAAAFKQGYKRVVIIGTDCPGLQACHIIQAFESLRRKDLVLGPATDGGYYLIGLSREEKSLFAAIPWGADTVLAKTLRIVEQKGLSRDLLEPLSDVDRPEDLKHVKLSAAALLTCSPASAESAPKSRNSRCFCSIIIPTQNEAESIAKLLPELLSIPGIEVLVVDGSSSDNTVVIAKTLGAQVLSASPGRALQMNRGAEAARGDILLFLHADTRLDPGFTEQVRDTLRQPGVAAGAFRLAIDGKGLSLRIIEWLTNFRSRFLQMPYGDQGLFLRADLFSALGGFPCLPIMEDFELVRRLKRKGSIKILPLAAKTSPRRWQKLGPLRTTAINQVTIICYLLGVNPQKLAKWYRGK